MKIYCPKCHTCYEIEVGLIPTDGKNLRCSRCGEVWLCTHKDMQAKESPSEDNNSVPQNVIANTGDELLSTPTETPETAKEQNENNVTDDEMNIIFSRLKDESEKIDTELDNLPKTKKLFPKIKKLLGWHSRLTVTLEIFTILLIIGLYIFGNRYDLVRKFPQMEILFSQFGVPSRVIGEGLEFQNVIRSYDSEENPNLLTIKGFIYNHTNSNLPLPPVSVNILDTDGKNISQSKYTLEEKEISTQKKIPFTLQVDVPQFSKYIMLTFTD